MAVSLTTLVNFNGLDGQNPLASLIIDAAGDLFGTTAGGETIPGEGPGGGEVFEIAKTGNRYGTPIILASSYGTTGLFPWGSLTTDAAGDLFGTAFDGGASSKGMVFEIPKTGHSYRTLITLVSFNGTNVAYPTAGLTPDAAGDLFGTTAGDGSSDGTVFEITGSGFVVFAAPSISGIRAGQATTAEAAVTPFSGVTIADTNSGATDTLTITLSGPGGTLAGTGLTEGADGVYKLTGTAAAITTDLDALSFTPTAGAPMTISTTTFALSDKSSAFATAITNSTTTVLDTDPPPGFIIGPEGGSGVITGTAGADIIVAFGYDNTINSGGGNDTVSAGLGNATVSAGSGNDLIVLGGYDNSVTAGNDNDLVSGVLGDTSVTLGSGNDNVQIGGYDDTVTLGNGDDALSGPEGNALVSVGNGNDTITLGGYSDTITLGNGTDRVSGMQGLAFITTGSGNDTIVLGGYGNMVDAGGGTNVISGGIGNDTFVCSGRQGKALISFPTSPKPMATS